MGNDDEEIFEVGKDNENDEGCSDDDDDDEILEVGIGNEKVEIGEDDEVDEVGGGGCKDNEEEGIDDNVVADTDDKDEASDEEGDGNNELAGTFGSMVMLALKGTRGRDWRRSRDREICCLPIWTANTPISRSK